MSNCYYYINGKYTYVYNIYIHLESEIERVQWKQEHETRHTTHIHTNKHKDTLEMLKKYKYFAVKYKVHTVICILVRKPMCVSVNIAKHRKFN